MIRYVGRNSAMKNAESRFPILLAEKIFPILLQAGEIQMKYFGKTLEVKHKTSSVDTVTIADKMTDDFLRDKFSKMFPKDFILSEENANIPKEYSKTVWIIDPLDGTNEFIAQGKNFSIIIGKCVSGKPVFGMVYAPAMKMMWFAEHGKGAYEYTLRTGELKKIHVSKISDIKESRLIVRRSKDAREWDIFPASLDVKERIKLGGSGIKMAKIASGEFDIHINTYNTASKWDTCGPQIIIEEAEGKITDFKGRELDYTQENLTWKDSYFVTNGKLHKKVHDTIRVKR